MNRPLRGPQNPTVIDESTDTYDTIDWLVKNIPESNGKVGILGISYDGFLPLMALIHPHPALKVAVPMNPMVDGWMGDDWFHNGAFRQQNIAYIYDQYATRSNTITWWTSNYDDYDTWMRAGSAGALAKERGMDQIGFWNKVAAHPAYDAFWSDQALDKILAKEPLTVPTLLVHSLWDQEDIYGAISVWKAVKPKDTANDKLFLVMGPWHHGQEIEDGSTLGELHFGQRHRPLLPAARPRAVPRSLPQRRRVADFHRHRIRDRSQHVGAASVLACRMRPGLQHRAHTALSRAQPRSLL